MSFRQEENVFLSISLVFSSSWATEPAHLVVHVGSVKLAVAGAPTPQEQAAADQLSGISEAGSGRDSGEAHTSLHGKTGYHKGQLCPSLLKSEERGL